jgi:hypothetical protein
MKHDGTILPPDQLVIRLSRQAELQLTAWCIATGGREFSGLGEIEKNGNVIDVLDVHLLGVGTNTYTEFSFERSFSLGEDPRRKLWFHRHPLGDGNPGAHNWSGRDEQTATQEPLGAPPKLVQWSVAIVYTLGGWVGRVDIHVPQSQTFHCSVEPKVPTPETIQEAQKLLTPELGEYIRQLLREFEAKYEKKTYRTENFYVYTDGRDDGTGTGFYCPDCNIELTFAEQETGDYGYIAADLYVCTNCQQIFADVITMGAEILEESNKKRRKKKRKEKAYQRSWNNWFYRKR